MPNIFMQHPLQLFLFTELCLPPQAAALSGGLSSGWCSFSYSVKTVRARDSVGFLLTHQNHFKNHFFNTKPEIFPPLIFMPFGPATHSIQCCNVKLRGICWSNEWTNHPATLRDLGSCLTVCLLTPFPANILNGFNTRKDTPFNSSSLKIPPPTMIVWSFLPHFLTLSSIWYTGLPVPTLFEIALAKVTGHFPSQSNRLSCSHLTWTFSNTHYC